MTSDFLLCWAILHLTILTVYIFRPDYAPESSSEESEEEFIVKKTKQKSEVKEEEIQEEEIKDRRLRRLQVTIAIIKKQNKIDCAPSEDSDQPVQLPSLVGVFTVRMKKGS